MMIESVCVLEVGLLWWWILVWEWYQFKFWLWDLLVERGVDDDVQCVLQVSVGCVFESCSVLVVFFVNQLGVDWFQCYVSQIFVCGLKFVDFYDIIWGLVVGFVVNGYLG